MNKNIVITVFISLRIKTPFLTFSGSENVKNVSCNYAYIYILGISNQFLQTVLNELVLLNTP